jgi:putative transposase
VSFRQAMTARGLASPVLPLGDGAPGLCAAGDQVLPAARRQRCLVHRARNTIATVAEVDPDAVRGDFWEIFDLPVDVEPGGQALAEARRAEVFASTWGRADPGAVAGVTDGLELLAAHRPYPGAHWLRGRHPNVIERTFGESRRRVKVIGRLPGERSALLLVWAVLDRAAAGWRGITSTPVDVRRLQMIRRGLGLVGRNDTRFDHDRGGEATAAA